MREVFRVLTFTLICSAAVHAKENSTPFARVPSIAHRHATTDAPVPTTYGLGREDEAAVPFACGGCYNENQGGPLGLVLHAFEGSSCTDGPQCYDCDSWNSCHSNQQSGKCYEWHNGCGSPTEEVLAMLGGDTTTDLRAAVQLVDEYPASVRIDKKRALVLVVDCGGSVAAYRTITGVQVSRVERLP